MLGFYIFCNHSIKVYRPPSRHSNVHELEKMKNQSKNNDNNDILKLIQTPKSSGCNLFTGFCISDFSLKQNNIQSFECFRIVQHYCRYFFKLKVKLPTANMDTPDNDCSILY